MNQNLSLNDLGQVIEELHDASLKWYKIGLQLKVSPTCLDKIKEEESDSSDKLLEMLKAWLKKVEPKPTWSALVKVLRTRSVGEEKEAIRLEEKYCIAPKMPSAATTRASEQQPKGTEHPMPSKQQPQVADTETALATSVPLQKSTKTTTKRASASTDTKMPTPKISKLLQQYSSLNIPSVIMNLEIKCSNAENGCSWKGKLEELDHHRQTCLKEVVACPYSEVGCEIRCLREELEDHQIQSQKHHLDRTLETIKTLKDELHNHPPLIIVMPNATYQTETWYSPPFYTSARGYKIQLVITPQDENMSMKVSGMTGDNDDHLKWPCCGTVHLLLRTHIRNCKNCSFQISFTYGTSKAQPITPGSDITSVMVLISRPAPKEIIIRDVKQYIKDNSLSIEINEVRLGVNRPWILNPQAVK